MAISRVGTVTAAAVSTAPAWTTPANSMIAINVPAGTPLSDTGAALSVAVTTGQTVRFRVEALFNAASNAGNNWTGRLYWSGATVSDIATSGQYQALATPFQQIASYHASTTPTSGLDVGNAAVVASGTTNVPYFKDHDLTVSTSGTITIWPGWSQTNNNTADLTVRRRCSLIVLP